MNFIQVLFLLKNPLSQQYDGHRLIFVLKNFVIEGFKIFRMNKVQIKRINEFSWIEYLTEAILYIPIIILNDQINTFYDNLFWKITTKQSKQLIIIKAVSLMILKFEYFYEIVQETNPV